MFLNLFLKNMEVTRLTPKALWCEIILFYDIWRQAEVNNPFTKQGMDNYAQWYSLWQFPSYSILLILLPFHWLFLLSPFCFFILFFFNVEEFLKLFLGNFSVCILSLPTLFLPFRWHLNVNCNVMTPKCTVYLWTTVLLISTK